MKTKPIFVDCEQNSKEWDDLRMGKITGSKFGTVMANHPKAFGDPAKRYAEAIALERIVGVSPEGYSNDWMQRGHELEPIARRKYEEDTFTEVSNGGFFYIGNIGVSPDGIVGEGLIEIKSVAYTTHFKRLRMGGYDSTYRWQVQGGMWVTGKKWCDFISFCPDFPEDKQIYVHRIYPDEKDFKSLEERLNKFEELITQNIELL